MKPHSDGLWLNLLPSEVDSPLCNPAREQSVSPNPEDIPFEEGEDMEDEMGINCFKTELTGL